MANIFRPTRCFKARSRVKVCSKPAVQLCVFIVIAKQFKLTKNHLFQSCVCFLLLFYILVIELFKTWYICIVWTDV